MRVEPAAQDAGAIIGALGDTIRRYDALDVPRPTHAQWREMTRLSDRKDALEAELAYAEPRAPAEALAMLGMAMGKLRGLEENETDPQEHQLDAAELHAIAERAGQLDVSADVRAVMGWHGSPVAA